LQSYGALNFVQFFLEHPVYKWNHIIKSAILDDVFNATTSWLLRLESWCKG